MTEQIDRDDLRNDIESILGDTASSPTPRYWAQAADKLLDALDKAERAFREEALRHGFTLRALGQAEYRATRAEAQADIRGRAVAIYQQRAREAEARIKAVRELHQPEESLSFPACPEGCCGWCAGCGTLTPCDTIRALESVTPPRQ